MSDEKDAKCDRRVGVSRATAATTDKLRYRLSQS